MSATCAWVECDIEKQELRLRLTGLQHWKTHADESALSIERGFWAAHGGALGAVFWPTETPGGALWRALLRA
jgi:hypothetical protein